MLLGAKIFSLCEEGHANQPSWISWCNWRAKQAYTLSIHSFLTGTAHIVIPYVILRPWNIHLLTKNVLLVHIIMPQDLFLSILHHTIYTTCECHWTLLFALLQGRRRVKYPWNLCRLSSFTYSLTPTSMVTMPTTPPSSTPCSTRRSWDTPSIPGPGSWISVTSYLSSRFFFESATQRTYNVWLQYNPSLANTTLSRACHLTPEIWSPH